jgi:hypothetical protein
MKRDVYRRIELVVLGVFIILVFLLLPYQVFAGGFVKEDDFYYTYGGFNAVVDAWKRVSLFFSDDNNKKLIPLYAGAIILGIIVLYFMVLAKATLAGSARFNLASWGIPVVFGMLIYAAFLSPIAPKDQIVVYDTVLNRVSEPMNNIPKIIAVPAKVLSKIENDMINIVKVSSSLVEDYQRNAGGTGFTILSQFGDPITISMAGLPIGVQQTAYQFIKDCLIFELARNGTTLTAQDISSGKVDFISAIRAAENPGVPTVYYDDETGQEIDYANGTEVTCQSAGEQLISYINKYINDDINLNRIAKTTCALSGFNIDVPQELNACRDLIVSTYTTGVVNATSNATGSTNPLTLLSYQAFFAHSLISALNTLNPESSIKLMATKEAASQYLGLAIHANTWLPVIRETLRAVAIAISPIVLLFAVTPLVGRALGFMLGMMIWVVTWAVIDAILHSAAVAQAQAASAQFSQAITNGSPGVMFFVLLPSFSSKVAAVFGAIRWTGLGLATVLTGMLIKFGGAALAMVAGSITGAAQSAGAAMGRMVADVTSPIRADLVPTVSWTNAAFEAGGVAELSRGLTEFQSGSLLGQSRAGAYLGAGQIAQSTFLSNIETVARNLALGTPDMAEKAGRVAGQQLVGSTLGMLELTQQFGGMSVTEMAKQKTMGANFRKDFFGDPYVNLGKGLDGRWHVLGVNYQLLSADLRQLKQQSYQKVYEKLQQALRKMDYEELTRLYNDNKHLFSKEDRKTIENLLRKARELHKANKVSNEQIYYEDSSGSASIGASGGGTVGLLSGGVSVSARKSAGETSKTNITDESTLKNDLVRAFSDAFANIVAKQDSHAVGKAFEKIFKNSEEFSEAMKAAEQYKEAESLESAMSVNALPLMLEKFANKYYSQYGEVGLNNRYSMAYRDLITAIHSGDTAKIKQFMETFQEIQNEFTQKEILPPPNQGKNVQADVVKEIQDTRKRLKDQEERPKGIPNKGANGPVVYETPKKQEVQRPGQPKKTSKLKRR